MVLAGGGAIRRCTWWRRWRSWATRCWSSGRTTTACWRWAASAARDMRMKVADRRDWFAVEGGARSAERASVPLAALLAAIREGRRYVAGGRARLRAHRGDAARGAGARRGGDVPAPRRIAGAAVASDPLVGLVEDEAQLEASARVPALRRRMREGRGRDPAVPAGARRRRCARTSGRASRGWRGSATGARARPRRRHGPRQDGAGAGACCSIARSSGPALVVAPTSVVCNWVARGRALRAGAARPIVYRGAGDRAAASRSSAPATCSIVSYGLLVRDADALAASRFATLVVRRGAGAQERHAPAARQRRARSRPTSGSR